MVKLRAEVLLLTSNGLPDEQVDLCSNASHAHIVKDGHGAERNEQSSSIIMSFFHSYSKEKIMDTRGSYCSLLALLHHQLLFNLFYWSINCSLKKEWFADNQLSCRRDSGPKQRHTHVLYCCYTRMYYGLPLSALGEGSLGLNS